MNAFFQLFEKRDGTYIRLIPNSENGEKLRYEEVLEYLNDISIYGIDRKTLHFAVSNLKNTVEIKLSNETGRNISEKMKVNISADSMKVFVRFYPPNENGALLTASDIVNTLLQNGIKVKVKEEVMKEFFNHRIYCKDFLMVEGTALESGHDARIEYFFNVNLSNKPKLNEDGSVNFFQLDNIGHVKAGQLLARLTPQNNGKPGMNVFGAIIKPPSYKKLILKHGQNIRMSEDGRCIYTMIDGHATLVEGKVFVSNLYVVNHVDISTGDIEYNGNVLVKGNVTNGLTINALGNIEVQGVVEGATLIAGGHIILQRGIQGMGKGSLKANGNVISKFIESSTVSAGGFVQTESILHSKVYAKGSITVAGKKGYITGGVVRSFHLVSAKMIGSPMGIDTTIEVGVEPGMKENYNQLIKEIQNYEKELYRIEPVITTYAKKARQGIHFTKEQLSYIQILSEQVKEIEHKLSVKRNLAEEAELIFSNETDAKILASDIVYPGVKLVISDTILYMRDEKKNCQFVRENGEIKMT